MVVHYFETTLSFLRANFSLEIIHFYFVCKYFVLEKTLMWLEGFYIDIEIYFGQVPIDLKHFYKLTFLKVWKCQGVYENECMYEYFATFTIII